MKSIFIKSSMLLLAFGMTVSCVNNDDYNAPNADCIDPAFTANKSVADIKAEASSRAQNVPVLYVSNTIDFIEGYVVSNDEKGNFYKTVYLQTKPTDGSAPIGFNVPLDLTTMWGEGFYPGKKVVIRLNGLYTAIVDGALSIGGVFQSSPVAPQEIGRISELQWKNFVFPTCDEVSEEELVQHVTLAQAYTNDYLNKLIEIDEVQFGDGSVGRTYFDVDSGGGATNHSLISASIPPSGSGGIIRFSSFTSFAEEIVPSGSGSIRGVMTRFGSTFQFQVRSLSDIKLDGPRVDAYPPKVGNAIEYPTTFTENFESYATSTGYNGANFPKYINDAFVGSKYWDVRSFSNNKYAQFSSFNSNQSNRVFLIFPVTMTPGYKFSFKTLNGFYNGNALKVYYSTDYTPGADIAQSTLVDITSTFAFSQGNTSGYATTFTNSGDFIIPSSVSGQGYFFIEYSGVGNSGVTTTMELDDVRLAQ
ncbi:MAG: hypothetical protein EOP06_15910 [Proteobacteria bacterium]|nr:MAG: hypothetical protein EOP06_15910 [Pseudomonadota bacterium]